MHRPSQATSYLRRVRGLGRVTQRVFDIVVPECLACQARTRVLAAIHPPEGIRAILECFARSEPSARSRRIWEDRSKHA